MTQTRTPTPATARQQPPRLEPAASFRLTGRGAVIALLGFSFLSLLLAAWTGWGTLADAAFVCGCGVVTYYTRATGLRAVVVCPPLVFFAGCVCAEVVTSSGAFMAATGILVTLGTSALWLFTATALTVVIAIGRGFRPAIPRLPGMPAVKNLLDVLRDELKSR
jgi:hypothetical protein